MAYDIKHSRYLLQGACIYDESREFQGVHTVEEHILVDSINYKALSVIVDGTTQIIDLECIQKENI